MVKTVENLFKNTTSLLNPENLMQNSFLFAVLSIFLAMYGPRLQPKLPDSIRNLFDNAIFRGVVMFLVVYLSGSNMTMALTITVIFIVTMNLIHTSNASENFEGYYGPPLNSDSAYSKDAINFSGTAFYPLNDTDALAQMRVGEDRPDYEGTVNYQNSV